MRGILARAVKTAAIIGTAAILVGVAVTGANAAGARIVWRDPGELNRFKLFVAQPDEVEPRLMELYIENPDVTDEGSFTVDIEGLDPLRPTFFLMVGVTWQGFLTKPSNILELGSETFCEAFDVDGDGKVTTVDALAVARAAVGIDKGDPVELDASIVTALEILRVAATFSCR